VYWRLRRTQDAGGGVNVMDVPFRFVPCMAAGLAYYIAGKIRAGGSGVWGPIPMPAQTLSEADARIIANWIAAGAAR
jgi:hypothetical protein